MNYAGFWPRLLALIVDVIIMAPVFAFQVAISKAYSPGVAAVTIILISGLAQAYPIYFHARWGQTVGKMAAKIQVTQMDGTPILLSHAIRRSVVDVTLWIAYLIPTVYVLATWHGPAWNSLSWVAQSRVIAERSPVYDIYSIASQSWTWSEIVVLLFNRKRRALHDFIAGTVVIKKVPVPETAATSVSTA